MYGTTQLHTKYESILYTSILSVKDYPIKDQYIYKTRMTGEE
jgi:hypothetical protein